MLKYISSFLIFTFLHVNSIYISPNTFTVNKFIKDDNMIEYLNRVFDSVHFPDSVYKDINTNINTNTNTNTNSNSNSNLNVYTSKTNRYNPNNCICDGCYIENECLGFLRKHICNKINGFYCD